MTAERDQVLKIPYGTRDFLPAAAAEKRRLETELVKLFNAWGYAEVVTPTIEYLDTLAKGGDQTLEPRLFKLFDRDNQTLALRHEMTTPLARLAAGRMQDAPRPLRLAYVSGAYRYEQAQAGRQCEFYQAGVELMGSDTAAADAEVIALAVKSLENAGLEDFTVFLGQGEYLRNLLAALPLAENGRRNIEKAIEKHDLVGLAKVAAAAGLTVEEQAAVNEIPLLHGGAEVLARARSLTDSAAAQAALDDLAELRTLLAAYGAADRVVFDLGVIRNFGYYTGMVFEAYAPGLGFPLLGGGRYDKLLAEFGCPMPATGFALGIERLMLAKARQGQAAKAVAHDIYVAFAPGQTAAAIVKAREYRREGRSVVLAVAPQSEAEAKETSGKLVAEKLVYLA